MRLALLLLLFFTCATPQGSRAATATRPNIIFVLADDFGWRDLGCYGSTFYETPNIDRLAVEGIRFTDFYAACCVCSPTRASILTGKYPARLGLTDWLPGRKDRPDQRLLRPAISDHLPLEEVTFAEKLKQAGYRTGFIGKWHLGGPGFFPENQGFEINVGGCGLGHPPSYFSPYHIPTLTDGPKGEYLTDRLTDEAIKFIEESKSKPFLLYLSQYAVHNPQQAKPKLVEKFSSKLRSLPPSKGPEFLTEGKNQTRQVQNQPVYAAMIDSLDQSVGRILQKLKERGLEQNTMVIFTSDNGGLSTAEGSPTSNVPLRAGKGWPYEGGVREPLLVRWPSAIKRGLVTSQVGISTDFFPTFLEVAGVEWQTRSKLDGLSLVPWFNGAPTRERTVFWHYPHYSNQGGGPSGAIRRGDYKLIEWYEDMRVDLFDLGRDESEQNNLASSKSGLASELRQQLHQWRSEVQAKMPRPNPDYQRE